MAIVIYTVPIEMAVADTMYSRVNEKPCVPMCGLGLLRPSHEANKKSPRPKNR